MKIIVASKNPIKIKAVDELIRQYNFITDPQVEGVNTESRVSNQPRSLEETIRGAINRAKNAFNNCDLSFGIESGIFDVPYTKAGVMDICACVIYDRVTTHIGLSSAFEPPKKITDLMKEKNIEMSDACFEIGITSNPKVGNSEGLIGIVTNGRLNRLDYTKQAVMTALIHLEYAHLYKP